VESISLYCAILMSILFLSTGIDKFLRFHRHVASIKNYRIIHSALIKPAAITLGALEVSISLCLLIGKGHEIAVIIGLIMLITYTCAMVHQLRKGDKNLNCGCGGLIGNHTITWKSVGRNIFLIVCLLIVEAFTNEHYYTINTIIPTVLSSSLFVLITITALKLIEYKKVFNLK
jgi:uncharacterized membrane protein YphA (DoxX/SURF4 family)